jgi:outer membrane protein assembly factor BamB
MVHLFIGMNGSVMALDRTTGEAVWKSPLKGHDFVNVVLDGGQLYAATAGELYCLDPATGKTRWKNELKGMGFGLITIAQSADGNRSVMEEKRKQDEAASADSGGVAAASVL